MPLYRLHCFLSNCKTDLKQMLNLSTGWRWVVNFMSHLLYPQEITPRAHWIGSWMGSRTSLDVLGGLYCHIVKEMSLYSFHYNYILLNSVLCCEHAYNKAVPPDCNKQYYLKSTMWCRNNIFYTGMQIVLLIQMHSLVIPAAVTTHKFQTCCKKNPLCTVQWVDLRHRHRKLCLIYFIIYYFFSLLG